MHILLNTNYLTRTTISELHLHVKSGGQIDGQMSFQSPVVWWYREVNCEVVGMCVETVPVLGAEFVDFLFNWCDFEDLVVGQYSARTMVRRLSCTGLSLGSIPVFRRSKPN
jgi:hypothetical protein